MRKIILTITACSLIFISACKNDSVVKPMGKPYILSQNSRIKWKGKAVGGNFNEGFIGVKGVTNAEGFDFDVLNGEIKGGEFIIPVSSIDVTSLPASTKPGLENHLKSADFFYIALHPAVNFKIISAKPNGANNSYQVNGEMKLLGQTHPLNFPAQIVISANQMIIKADFTFNQSIWGMNYRIDPSYPENDRLVAGIDVSLDLIANAK